MLLEMDDTFAIAKVNYADGMAYMVAGEDAMPLTIDAEGKLNMTLTVEEIPTGQRPRRMLPMLPTWASGTWTMCPCSA